MEEHFTNSERPDQTNADCRCQQENRHLRVYELSLGRKCSRSSFHAAIYFGKYDGRSGLLPVRSFPQATFFETQNCRETQREMESALQTMRVDNKVKIRDVKHSKNRLIERRKQKKMEAGAAPQQKVTGTPCS